MQTDMPTLGENIRRFREEAGFSQAELARRAGVSQPTIFDLEAGNQQSTKKLPEIARALSKFIGDLDESYASLSTQASVSVHTVPVRGLVAAGLWMEYDDISQDDFEEIASVATRKYAGLEQFAFKVRGPSMDQLRIFDGDYIVCVPYWQARPAVQSEDIVVVERRDGHKIERTCKQLLVVKRGFELWPRSSDSRFSRPIRVPSMNSPTCEDGQEIEIIGLVISSVTPRG